MGETKVTQASGLLLRCFLEILLFTLLKSSKNVVRSWENWPSAWGRGPSLPGHQFIPQGCGLCLGPPGFALLLRNKAYRFCFSQLFVLF